jgi:transcriptional regulator with XRE-family HTH domain
MIDNDLKYRLKKAISAYFGVYGAQHKFAEALGVPDSTVSKYISGALNIPNEAIRWFGEHTDIRVEWILTGEPPMWRPIDLGESRQDVEELARRGHVVYYRGEEVPFEEIVEMLDFARRMRDARGKTIDKERDGRDKAKDE